jgi:hypothetical protein
MRTTKFFLAALFSVAIASCGGGGGSSSTVNIPTAAVKITTSNAAAVAKASITPTQGVVNTGSGQAGVVGVVTQASGHSLSVLDISLAEFNRARSLKFSPAVAGVIPSVTLYCTTSGTVTGSVQDLDSSGTFTVGDILTMTFHNCVEPTVSGGSNTTNGIATFSITAASNTLGQNITPFSAAFTLTFSNFTSKDNVTNIIDTINGDISFSTNNDGTNTTGMMSGASLRMDSSVDGSFLLTNYNFSFTEATVVTLTSPYSYSVNMTVASTVANGSVTITTTTPFTGVGVSDPTAGVMVITGANNSTLTLTSNADGIYVGIVVDEDGAGGPTAPVTITNPATGLDYTWAEL